MQEAAAELPLTVLAGMELCTAEEIHVVCLFPTAEAAEAAGAEAEAALPDIANDPAIFGAQEIRDSEERLVGTVDKLLINATSISVDDVRSFAARYGGICFPAHIEKQSNSIFAAFGYLPEHLGFRTVEVAHPAAFLPTAQGAEIASRCNILTDSDAHMLESISEAEHGILLKTCDFNGLKGYIL
ncbi:MAG: phosphoesterase [Angelakisella sp.]